MKKMLRIVGILCVLIVASLCIIACGNKKRGEGNNGESVETPDGTYYLYTDSSYDKSDFITFHGDTWSNNGGGSGVVIKDGDAVRLQISVMGEKSEYCRGTLSGGVFRIEAISDVNVHFKYYCKEGKNVPANATVHNVIRYPYIAESCTEDGVTEHYTCIVCGVSFAEQNCATVIADFIRPATGHKYGEWEETPPVDCSADGVKTRTCSVCDDVETEVMPAPPHTYSGVYSSCNVTHWQTCDVCGGTTEEKRHTYDSKNKCTECGYTLAVSENLVFYENYDGNSYHVATAESIEDNVIIPTVIIPAYYEGKPVVLGSNVSFAWSKIQNLYLAGNITTIGTQAFMSMIELKSVVIPKSVEEIGMQAFANCGKLTDIWCEATEKPSGWNNSWLTFTGGQVTVHWGNEWKYVKGVPTLYVAHEENEPHVYSDEYKYDNDYHWYEAICDCENVPIVKEDHVPENGKCSICGNSNYYTEGLEFTLNTNKQSYSVSGIGESDDTVIHIPQKYNGLSVISILSDAFRDCSRLTSVTIGNSVTSIGEYAFAGCSSLTSVTIGNSVTSIGKCAFRYCSSLTSVTIGNSVTSIGEYAFYDCNSLTSVTIPNSVTSIGKCAFHYCNSLTSVTIGNSVTSIGEYAFNSCNSLTSIYYTGDIASWCAISRLGNLMYQGRTLYIDGQELTGALVIPDSVTSIGNYAFIYCIGITSITIHDRVTSIGRYAFSNCSSLESITIPNSVTSIGERAFGDCNSLTNVTISDSVTSIGSAAFYGCNILTSIYYTGDIASWCGIDGLIYLMSSSRTLYISGQELTGALIIPDSVTSIGGYAFSYCSNLESITIPNSVTSIGYDAFSYCSNLESITIPNSVTSIGYDAFYGCNSLTSITIPNSVTSIGRYAFSNCSSLTSITIPDSVTSIGYDAFYGCNSLTIYCELESKPSEWDSDWNYSNCPVVWDYKNNDKDENGYVYAVIDGIRYSLKDGMATVVGQQCSVTQANIPVTVIYKGTTYSVTSIGNYTFRSCHSLTSITIPDSVTSIGDRAFLYCSSLTSITIPDSVTSIGYDAFYGCNSLTIYCELESKPSEWDSDWNYSNCPVVWDYKNNDKDENGYVYAVKDGIHYSLKDCVATVIRQPSSITQANISATVIYKGTTYRVTSIGEYAFYDCNSLTSITIPDSVTSIGSSAFDGCSSLTSITIPDSVTSIGDYAFYNCSKLTSITIPNRVTSIGRYAFSNCSNLESITIPNSVTSIGSYAFYDCSKLTSITIPNSVTSIGSYAFYDCSKLTSITIPNSVTSIGVWAFYYCHSLTSITYNGTKAQWKAISKGSDWNRWSSEYTVICTDGTLSKSES